eukprot:674929-Rhodomonas_salina.2
MEAPEPTARVRPGHHEPDESVGAVLICCTRRRICLRVFHLERLDLQRSPEGGVVSRGQSGPVNAVVGALDLPAPEQVLLVVASVPQSVVRRQHGPFLTQIVADPTSGRVTGRYVPLSVRRRPERSHICHLPCVQALRVWPSGDADIDVSEPVLNRGVDPLVLIPVGPQPMQEAMGNVAASVPPEREDQPRVLFLRSLLRLLSVRGRFLLPCQAPLDKRVAEGGLRVHFPPAKHAAKQEHRLRALRAPFSEALAHMDRAHLQEEQAPAHRLPSEQERRGDLGWASTRLHFRVLQR